MINLKQAILQGIPSEIPTKRNINTSVSHAPNRKNILNKEEKKLAICNAAACLLLCGNSSKCLAFIL